MLLSFCPSVLIKTKMGSFHTACLWRVEVSQNTFKDLLARRKQGYDILDENTRLHHLSHLRVLSFYWGSE